MKPREFWIHKNTGSVRPALGDFGKNLKVEEYFHVIEYSAVASLQAEIEEFKTGVQNFKCSNCNNIAGPFYNVNLMTELEALRKERDECKVNYTNMKDTLVEERDHIRADLKLAVEALEEVSQSFLIIGVPEIVFKTLAKLTKETK